MKDETKKAQIEKELKEARYAIGLYSIKELTTMFECGRTAIDYAVNSGQINYISPNGRARYIYIHDYLDYFKNKKK